jgi:hypothetical protein
MSDYNKYRESHIKASKKWQKENPEKAKEYRYKYRHTEKGRKAAMEAQRRYRAKKKNGKISLVSEN